MEERDRFPIIYVAIAAAVLVVVVIFAMILMYSSRYSYYSWGPGFMGGFMGWPMLIMFPLGIIVLIAFAYIVYRAFRWGGGCCGGPWGHNDHYYSNEEKETAMEILRRRYAKGEITKEQFDQMKKDLLV